ncbi:MAG: hypothetical protein KGL35_25605 [Bradyrhizobium sp.]|nr:hypothetical protein [Bradyrhizobium sp.]
MPTMHLAGRDIPVNVELGIEDDEPYIETVTIIGHELPQYIHDYLLHQETERQRVISLEEAEDVMDIIDRGARNARR